MRSFFLLLIASAALLVGCSGTGGGTNLRQEGIYLVDSGNNRIVLMSNMQATFFTSFGSAVTGITHAGNGTVGKDGRLYLIDKDNSSIVRFDDTSGAGRVEFGTHGTGTGQFLNPVRVTTDFLNRIYVVDHDQNLLIRFQANGNGWTTVDLSNWFAANDNPDVFVDIVGRIYLAGGSTVVRLNDMTTTGAATFGSPGSGTGEFNTLTAITLDDLGRIYVADSGNDRVVRFDSMTGANWKPYGTSGNGTGQFDSPGGVGVDHQLHVFISDTGNNRLVRVDDMDGNNWIETNHVGIIFFNAPLSVFPHVPQF